MNTEGENHQVFVLSSSARLFSNMSWLDQRFEWVSSILACDCGGYDGEMRIRLEVSPPHTPFRVSLLESR